MSTYDDRDAAMTRDPMVQQQPPQQQYGYGMQGYRGMGVRRGGPSETKPFFMTSEFLMTVLCVIAVAITAATAADIDSRLATMLISGLVAAYSLSRGIAKSGTHSRAADPRDDVNLTRGHDGR